MDKKTVAVIGGIAGLIGLGWLVSKVSAKPTVQVALTSKPIRTIILVDDKLEVATPATVKLQKGKHKFAAVPKSPDLTLTYAFHSWTMNGQVASHNRTIEIDITNPTTITANFIVSQSGIYPVIPHA
jgi:hypothetical protein